MGRGQAARGIPLKPLRPLPPLVYPPDLPVSGRREELVALFAREPVVIVCGETGSGKTTQLPKMLLEAGVLRQGLIGHTQPRRIAARTVARRLATELVGAPERFVAHKVRFSDGTSADTAIKVMTDGVLLAEARADPLLRRYDAIIIDEAHERSLNIDFLLGFLKRLRPRRPDLRIVITSATIDPQRFADYFGGAPIVEVSGRSYPVETRYRPLSTDPDDAYDPGLNAGIVQAIEEVRAEKGDIGRADVLVFLPGEREIREAAFAIEQAFGPRLAVLPLYSRLAWADQERVFKRSDGQRVVLSTNVAETSLTVPGIRSVIDSGLARVSRYSPRAKLLRLPIEAVSQASADQRRGRCGRVGPGLCIRLFDERDYADRPAHTEPEVLRTNLASVILQMAALGLGRPDEFPFIEPPDTRAINDGYRLLEELEAVDGAGRITDTGRQMARLPVDPRLARMLVAARGAGALAEVLVLTAGLSIQDPRERPLESRQKADAVHAEDADPDSDFMTLLTLWTRYQTERAARSRNALRRWCAERFLSASRMREWEELEAQLRQISEELGWSVNTTPANAQAVHRALLAGLLSNIGTKTEEGDYRGPRGRRFRLAPGRGGKARSPRWLMAAQIVETDRVYARMITAIEPAWIEAAAMHLVRRDYTDPEWQPDRGIVVCRESVTLWGLPIVAGRRVNFGRVEPVAAREIFVREALVHGRAPLKGAFVEANGRLKARLREEEAALRRHTVLVDEVTEAECYLRRLPADVHSLAAFERWRQGAQASEPAVLMLTEQDLRRTDAPRLEPETYPAMLALAGNRLPVNYRFDPLDPADGATVTVPEALLARLSAGELDWGIPGWRTERVTALIRGLPKALRKSLVPAPDVAARVAAALESRTREPFFDALADELGRVAGSPVDPSLLSMVTLEPYLSLNLKIVDASGRIVAQGRDLASLRRNFRGRGAAAVAAVATAASDEPWVRGGLTRLDVAVIPESVEVLRQGVRIDLHPTLKDERTHVAFDLVADAKAAEAGLRRGLVRLAALALAPVVRTAERLVGADRELLLLHQPVGVAKSFVGDVVERALERRLLPESVALPRERRALEATIEVARAELVADAERLARELKTALGELRQVRAALASLPPGCDAVLVEDARRNLAALVPEGFVRTTPEPWLGGLGRYLTALRRRIVKIPEARGPKGAAQYALLDLRRRSAALLARVEPGEALPDELLELRWLVEEYAVQLYAQELRTRVPVSPKRLAGAFAQAEARLARR